MVRNHVLGIAFACAIILSGSSTASAQTKQPSKAPRSPSSAQAHDLSGVWMDDHPRPNTVQERYWIYELTLEEPPMTAWGQAQYQAAKSSFGYHAVPLAETNDPIFRSCSPPGFPRKSRTIDLNVSILFTTAPSSFSSKSKCGNLQIIISLLIS